MKKQYFYPEQDGFYGVYYLNPAPSGKAVIVMLGDSSDDRMVVSGVKWLRGADPLDVQGRAGIPKRMQADPDRHRRKVEPQYLGMVKGRYF